MKKILSILLSVTLVFSMLIPITSFAEEGTFQTVSGELNYDYANDVLDIVNQFRRDAGLNELKAKEDLTKSAMIRAAETVLLFDHYRPNGEVCFTAFRHKFAFGENIAFGQRTPQSVMNSWMNSEGHKENILSPNYKEIGIGCIKSGGTYYWVQCFSGADTEENFRGSGKADATVKVSQTAGVQSYIESEQTVVPAPPAVDPPAQSNPIVITPTDTVISDLPNDYGNSVTITIAPEEEASAPATTAPSKPKKPVIKAVKKQKKGFTVKWGKVSKASGYQIRYSTSKNMSKATKISVKGNKTFSKQVKKLKSKKKYYVQVRAYKNTKGGKLYSSWSAKKSIITK